MFTKFLVISTLVGIVASNKCYVSGGLKSEFTSHAITCDSRDYCQTASYGDYISTQCARDSCSEESAEMLANGLQLFASANNDTIDSREVVLECCKGDLCSKPTASGEKTDGVECYAFTGPKSSMQERAQNCNYGSACVTAIAGQFVSVNCLIECSEANKRITMATVFFAAAMEAMVTGQELPEEEMVLECCTDNLCNALPADKVNNVSSIPEM